MTCVGKKQSRHSSLSASWLWTGCDQFFIPPLPWLPQHEGLYCGAVNSIYKPFLLYVPLLRIFLLITINWKVTKRLFSFLLTWSKKYIYISYQEKKKEQFNMSSSGWWGRLRWWWRTESPKNKQEKNESRGGILPSRKFHITWSLSDPVASRKHDGLGSGGLASSSNPRTAHCAIVANGFPRKWNELA